MKKKLDYLGVSAFCESMAMMTRAGISSDEAISLLESGENRTGGVLEGGLRMMKEKIDGGATLAAAMKESGIFPDYAVQMTEAGESSGKLENVLFRLSEYYAEQKTLSEKIRGALTYPAAMLGLVIAVLAVMLALVLPAFTDVYNSLTGSLSSSGYRYVWWAYAFCWVALGVMLVLAILLVIGLIMLKTGHRKALETVLSKSRLCSSIFESMALFRFTSALATFLACGNMQDEAVRNSLPMTGYGPTEKKLKECLSHMDEGHSFAKAAYEEGIFEPVYGRMLLAGEKSGNLEEVLNHLCTLLGEKWSGDVDRLVGVIDPLLSGVLMFTVGVSLLSVMLPLIGIMNSIG